MTRLSAVQVIKSKGKPEWAVIPYKDYLYLHELEELSHEAASFKKLLDRGEEELIPQAFAERLIEGENAIHVWREYRRMTQTYLAEKVNISKSYLSQIERDERKPSVDVLKKIASVLNVSLDDLI